MNEGAAIARIAALVSDPSRSRMLGALMSGMALTANELAQEAGVTPSTASSHLAALVGADLISVISQGRHRYFRIANDDVAAGVEQIGVIATGHDKLRGRPGPSDPALRSARVCYNHIAGALGVRIFQSLIAQDCLTLTIHGVDVTGAGHALLARIGITERVLPPSRGTRARLCLDWSERTYHLGGAVATALLTSFLTYGWVRRTLAQRALDVTPHGTAALADLFPNRA
jgi:DNA-binding transcriptional ArsR family regulator